MKMTKTFSQHYITIGNKKHEYILESISDSTTKLICEDANINQEFPNEDIPEILQDLANLIIAEKEYSKTQSETIRFRVTPEDKKQIELAAIKNGYQSISSFLRDISLTKS